MGSKGQIDKAHSTPTHFLLARVQSRTSLASCQALYQGSKKLILVEDQLSHSSNQKALTVIQISKPLHCSGKTVCWNSRESIMSCVFLPLECSGNLSILFVCILPQSDRIPEASSMKKTKASDMMQPLSPWPASHLSNNSKHCSGSGLGTRDMRTQFVFRI